MSEQRSGYVVDGDGGSSPIYFTAVPEQCPNCHKAAGKCICTTDEVEHALALDIDGLRRLTAQWIETLQTQGRALDTTRAHVRLLQAQVAALQTDLLGAQTGIGNLERRCTCHEQAQEPLAELTDRVRALELARVAETAED